MKTNPELLEERVAAAVRACVGRRLRSVIYGCLHGECTLEELHEPDFYFGGELLLEFESDRRMVVTWDENAGWAGHFSVQARSTTAFLPGALTRFDAEALELWRPHVGQALECARVLGVDGVPFAVELQFQQGSVVTGTGLRGMFGDGDDTIVRGANELARWEGFEFLEQIGPVSNAESSHP